MWAEGAHDAAGVPTIVALPGAEGCASRLAAALGAPICRIESRRFPDGETYLRVLGDIAGREAAVVAQLRDPDPQLPGLLFLADALRDLGATRVGLVAPYLPYMRQDARFQPGEAITSRSFARLVDASFAWLVTVDPHLHRIAALDALYGVPCAAVSSAGAIAEWVAREVVAPFLVGPDAESAQWVSQVAGRVGCRWTVLSKERLGDREVELTLPDLGTLAGHTPVLVDDIVSSATTLAVAVRRLRDAGCAAPVCIGVHAVCAEGAAERLAAAGGARLVTCDTLAHPSNAIDVSAVLAAGVRGLAGEAAARRVP
jgi:ribose-phosphate pyrophosphokinase